MKDHIVHLKRVMQILGSNCLTVKKSKCEFATTQVEYLGHIINGKEVAIDPKKIEAIKSWHVPTSITLLSFLGLTRYYRRFIKNYRVICRPLHGLLKKYSFQWQTKDTTVFNNLKEKLSSAPVLALPNFTLPFTLEIDASWTGIGAILMQLGQPIAFYSQVLGPKVVVQSTYYKEALAILRALKR
jgi:hypothetical protein